MKAIILARVSTREQEAGGHYIPTQIDRLIAYSKRKEFEVTNSISMER